jgi:hypothetical protein
MSETVSLRRPFLVAAVCVLSMSLTVNSAGAQTQRDYSASRHFLTVDNQFTSVIRVLDSTSTVSVMIGAELSQSLATWLVNAVDKQTTKDVALASFGLTGTATQTVTAIGGSLSAITLPKLDAESKNDALLTVTVTSKTMRNTLHGPNAPAAGAKSWLVSDFRVSIPGVNIGQTVMGVEEITVHPAQSCPAVTLTVAGKGIDSVHKALAAHATGNASVEYTTPNATLYKLSFTDFAIISVDAPVIGHGGIKSAQVHYGCKSVKLDIPSR